MSESTSSVTVRMLTIAPVNAGRLLALADVEVTLDGISIVIHGVQVRADGGGTEIALPRYRGTDGSWQTAISVPEEIRAPIGDVVIAGGIEAGILKERAVGESEKLDVAFRTRRVVPV